MLRLVAIIVAIVPLATAIHLLPGSSSGFTNCNTGGSDVHSIDVTPCSSMPCHIARGQPYAINVTFTPSATTPTVSKEYHAIVGGFSVPVPLGGDQPCGHGLTCPVTGGLSQSYVTSITAPTFAPTMSLVIQSQLKNDQHLSFLCIEMAIQLV